MFVGGVVVRIYSFFGVDDFFSCLHRLLWQAKVPSKSFILVLSSETFSCTLGMGAKSTLKSLETFAFAKNRPIRRESLETFDPSKVVDESTPAEIIPVRV